MKKDGEPQEWIMTYFINGKEANRMRIYVRDARLAKHNYVEHLKLHHKSLVRKPGVKTISAQPSSTYD